VCSNQQHTIGARNNNRLKSTAQQLLIVNITYKKYLKEIKNYRTKINKISDVIKKKKKKKEYIHTNWIMPFLRF
jgi:seryl-tRNA synthetase